MKTNFKDKLIENKWLKYQTKLSLSLRNEFDVDRDNLLIEYDKINNKTKSQEEYMVYFHQFHQKYDGFDKYYNCQYPHCRRSAYQYHKLLDVTRKSNKDKKIVKLKYDHFKNRKLTKHSLIKEHLWYNLKNDDSIVISGDYSTTICHEDIVSNTLDKKITKYYPNKPNSLKLNDIPVSYIEISEQNKNRISYKCNLLYFCFDMSSYCDVIDCILIMNKKKNKTNYFSYLPLEIIEYILSLTSLY